uniref:Uncharacterized protein n=1 Tax=Rhodosorus marinus TaxID=101924 RepID=A0A7S2ZJQ0_9RHOD|mmetsp:Transcript_21867/g.88995  ORF Transcript_21867/g.88995 Transcript_21867/m.88995 type:complete len:173 (+) Transcript_21867:173-691(+)
MVGYGVSSAIFYSSVLGSVCLSGFVAGGLGYLACVEHPSRAGMQLQAARKQWMSSISRSRSVYIVANVLAATAAATCSQSYERSRPWWICSCMILAVLLLDTSASALAMNRLLTDPAPESIQRSLRTWQIWYTINFLFATFALLLVLFLVQYGTIILNNKQIIIASGPTRTF